MKMDTSIRFGRATITIPVDRMVAAKTGKIHGQVRRAIPRAGHAIISVLSAGKIPVKFYRWSSILGALRKERTWQHIAESVLARVAGVRIPIVAVARLQIPIIAVVAGL